MAEEAAPELTSSGRQTRTISENDLRSSRKDLTQLRIQRQYHPEICRRGRDTVSSGPHSKPSDPCVAGVGGVQPYRLSLRNEEFGPHIGLPTLGR